MNLFESFADPNTKCKLELNNILNIARSGDLIFLRGFRFPFFHMHVGMFNGYGHVVLVTVDDNGNKYAVHATPVSRNKMLLSKYLHKMPYKVMKLYRPSISIDHKCLWDTNEHEKKYTGIRAPIFGDRHSCTSLVRNIFAKCSKDVTIHDTWRDGILPLTLTKDFDGDVMLQCGDEWYTYRIVLIALIYFLYVHYITKQI